MHSINLHPPSRSENCVSCSGFASCLRFVGILGLVLAQFWRGSTDAAPLPAARQLDCAQTSAITSVPGSQAVHVGVQPLVLGASALTHHVFVAGTSACGGSGALVMLSDQTGTVLGWVPLDLGEGRVQLLLDEQAHRLLIDHGVPYPHSMSIVNTLSGQLIRTVETGQLIAGLTLNERAHEFLVAIDPVGSPRSGNGHRAQPEIRAMDSRTGESIWTAYPGIGSIPRFVGAAASPIVSDGLHHLLYVSGSRGVGVFFSATGAHRGTLHLGPCGGELALRASVSRLYTASEGVMRDRYNSSNPQVNPPGYFCVVDAAKGKVLRKVQGHPGSTALVLGNVPQSPRLLVATQESMGAIRTTVRDANSGAIVRGDLSVRFPPFPTSDPASPLIYFASDLRQDTKSSTEVVTIRQYNTRINKATVVLPSAPYPTALAAVPSTKRLFLGVAGVDVVVIVQLH